MLPIVPRLFAVISYLPLSCADSSCRTCFCRVSKNDAHKIGKYSAGSDAQGQLGSIQKPGVGLNSRNPINPLRHNPVAGSASNPAAHAASPPTAPPPRATHPKGGTPYFRHDAFGYQQQKLLSEPALILFLNCVS